MYAQGGLGRWRCSGSALACLVAPRPVVVDADTVALHVFPYCEPGTFCGHSDQATLDSTSAMRSGDEPGMGGCRSLVPADDESGRRDESNPAPKHCADGDNAGTLCDHDSDCGGGGCENLPIDRTGTTRSWPATARRRAARCGRNGARTSPISGERHLPLRDEAPREVLLSNIARTTKDPATLLGFFCTADADGTGFFSGSTWAHEMGHYWGLVHTFCGCDDPADVDGATFHDCDRPLAARRVRGGVDWGKKKCTSDADCASPGVCHVDQLPVVNDTPPDACKFERLPRACSNADPVKKCKVNADCGVGEEPAAPAASSSAATTTTSTARPTPECADAGKGTCVCIPGADGDVVANIVDDHEWVSGYSSLYGLDTTGRSRKPAPVLLLGRLARVLGRAGHRQAG